jgi:hypothetical protein
MVSCASSRRVSLWVRAVYVESPSASTTRKSSVRTFIRSMRGNRGSVSAPSVRVYQTRDESSDSWSATVPTPYFSPVVHRGRSVGPDGAGFAAGSASYSRRNAVVCSRRACDQPSGAALSGSPSSKTCSAR